MVTRRSFLKYSGGSALTLFCLDRLGATVALAQVPGGSLGAYEIPKFRTPLLIPPVMPKAGREVQRGGKNIDYYEISVRQFEQQMLPEGMPATTVWGYGAVASASKRGLQLHHAPSLTIEAKWNTPVRVKWINDLKDSAGGFLPHLLPVDPTLHWANPPGGVEGRDSRPQWSHTPDAYRGPVPFVTHVHGAVGVGDESDGYPEAWYLCDAADVPAEYAAYGTWFEFFAAKAERRFGQEWGLGFAVFQYPNLNRASTIWYHDHTLGITRLNVYAGPAGFYLLRGGPGGEDDVLDNRSGARAVLPGPAPRANDKFPATKNYREICLAIQDRSFNADGSLFYPDSRAFFDGLTGPYVPHTDIAPLWNPEFFGNTLIVNGNTWPYLDVDRVRYRLRMLNGCQSRFLILDFAAIPGIEVWQIGTDGGFLDAAVPITAEHRDRLLLGPAERADLIVDFSRVPVGNYVLRNVGPDEPFGGGEPGVEFNPSDPASTGEVMQFRVGATIAVDSSTPAAFLQLPPLPAALPVTATRHLALVEGMSAFFDDAPAVALLGTVSGDPSSGLATWSEHQWSDPVSENPAIGSTEVWEIHNLTEDAHPIHVHEVVFEVLGRQPLEIDQMSQQFRVAPGSTPMPPLPGENGYKDTAIAFPGQALRIRAQFERAGRFVWHCHVLEHEDHEMMRPYRIGPAESGSPE